MGNRETRIGLLAVIIVSTCILAWFHSRVLYDLNHYFLGDMSDGLKNYYTVAYHVKHDQSYSRFEGMNHPHGEQVIFTDNQPLISNTVKFISQYLIDLSDKMVGVINLSMLLSIVVCSLFLFLIFRRFNLPSWFALIASIGIAFLSPQVLRMHGHYSLSYSYVIPMVWWLLMRFTSKPSIMRSVAVGLAVVLVSGLHFYYFGIALFFVGLYFLFSSIGALKKVTWKTKVTHFLIQIIIPFFTVRAWLWLTDPVTDRPSSPYGFLLFKSDWRSVFFPIGSPDLNYYTEFINSEGTSWEGRAYLGIVAGLLFLFIIGRLIAILVRKQKLSILPSAQQMFVPPLLAAFVLLLLAMGYPFSIDIAGKKLDFLLEFAGPLKQFRGIGRFAWVFFYVMNVLAFTTLYHWISRMKNESLKPALLLVPLCVLIMEMFLFNKTRPYELNRVPAWGTEEEREALAPWLAEIDTANFQAILPLPYFHIGSENFGIAGKGEVLKHAMEASFLTGLPTTAVQLSRTSYGQTRANIQLALEPYRPLSYMKNLRDPRPFLLWVEKEIPLRSYHQALIEESPTVYEDENIHLLALDTGAYRRRLFKTREAVEQERDTSKLYVIEDVLSSDSLKNFIYIDYEEKPGEEDVPYRGNGSFTGVMRGYKEVFVGSIPQQDTARYVFSAWVYLKEDTYPTNRLVIEEFDQDGNYLGYHSRSWSEMLSAMDGNWGLVEYEFDVHSQDSEFNFLFYKDTKRTDPVYADEVIIRKKSTHLYKRNKRFKNGRYYDRF